MTNLSNRTNPDDVFEREHKRQLFGLAVQQLKAELDATVFRIFEQYDLTDAARPRYEDLAHEHGLPVTTVTTSLPADVSTTTTNRQ